MKTTEKMFSAFTWPALLFSLVLTGSCTSIYFENPVPRDAAALRAFPESWAGDYMEEQADGEEQPVYRECLRLDRLSGTELMVSQETRIAEKDMPRFRAELEQRKKDGRLVSYTLSERFLIVVAPVDDKDRPGVTAEQQVTSIYKEGDWFILGHTSAPLILFDLKAGQLTKYDIREMQEGDDNLFFRVDSLSSRQNRLVALQKAGGIYLNVLRDAGSLWELYFVSQPAQGELRVKTSVVKDNDIFRRRLKVYNDITPFVKMEGEKDYIIAPTDQALDKLLADEHLFQMTVLKKIAD